MNFGNSNIINTENLKELVVEVAIVWCDDIIPAFMQQDWENPFIHLLRWFKSWSYSSDHPNAKWHETWWLFITWCRNSVFQL